MIAGANYQSRRTSVDYYLRDQLRIMSDLWLCRTSDLYVADDADDFNGTDLLSIDGQRIALRVREGKALAKYPDDFTIRMTRGRDGWNELDKIRLGMGADEMLYGYADGPRLVGWKLLDLTVVRRAAEAGYEGVQSKLLIGEDYYCQAFDLRTFGSYGRIVIATG